MKIKYVFFTIFVFLIQACGNKNSDLRTTSQEEKSPVVDIVDVETPVINPNISLNIPSQTYTAPASISLTAVASAQSGFQISKVEFYRNDIKIGEDLTSPYVYTQTGVAAGSYRYSAKAIDNRGLNTSTSDQIIGVGVAPVCIENATRSCDYSGCSGSQACKNNSWTQCELNNNFLTNLTQENYYKLSQCAKVGDIEKIFSVYKTSSNLTNNIKLAKITEILISKLVSVSTALIPVLEYYLSVFEETVTRDEIRALSKVLSSAGTKLDANEINFKSEILLKFKNRIIQNVNIDTNTRAVIADQIHKLGAVSTLNEILTNEKQKPSSSSELIYILEWLINRNLNRTYTFRPPNIPGYPNGQYGFLEGYFDGQKYLIYIPTGVHTQYKVLFSIHSTANTAEQYMGRIFQNTCPTSICSMKNDYSKNFMDQNGIVVIAPYFDIATFPNFEFFMQNEPGDKRADVFLLNLLQSVSEIFPSGKLKTDKFYIWGHSKGGQFVSSFAMNYPERILKAAAAGSGIYDHMFYLPSIFVQNSINPIQPQIVEFFKLPYGVIIGTKDQAEPENLHRRKTNAIRFMCDKILPSQNGCSFNSSFQCNRTDYISGETLTYRSTTSSCKKSFQWVFNGVHNGHQTYPHAAHYLFNP